MEGLETLHKAVSEAAPGVVAKAVPRTVQYTRPQAEPDTIFTRARHRR